MTVSRPPADMGPAGRQLWKSVLADFELGAHERLMLLQACHVADVCDALQAVIAADGPMLADPGGGPRAHPAGREFARQRVTPARAVVWRRVPPGGGDAGGGGTQYAGYAGRSG